MSFLQKPNVFFPLLGNILAIASSTYYLHTRLNYNLEEQQARLDEIEGTLRGHMGLIEDALDRIEGNPDTNKQETLYGQRVRDDNKTSQSKKQYNIN
jgi:Tfp pilus assembly protein PilW